MTKLTTQKVANALGISTTSLYQYIRRQQLVISKNSAGRYCWDQAILSKLQTLLVTNKSTSTPKATSQITTSRQQTNHSHATELLTQLGLSQIFIHNRRYLGNKHSLSQFIRDVVAQHCDQVQVVADVFAGTGAVAHSFREKQLITNDLLYSNYLIHYAWFAPEAYDSTKIIQLIYQYNQRHTQEANYMRDNFANTFFGANDCSKIGYIRADIEQRYQRQELNFKEYAILISSLLYSIDRIANTVGHYDAYRQQQQQDDKLVLGVILPNLALHTQNRCFNQDANTLVGKISCDLLYLDPPYNSRQYGDAYHLLENVARWQQPAVHGVARKMDRSQLKSDYCKASASKTLAQLIEQAQTKYILLSYNNMSNKGNDRSNAKISDEQIMAILSAKGKVTVFEADYKSFSTGKSSITNNKERLFLCEVTSPSSTNTTQLTKQQQHAITAVDTTVAVVANYSKSISESKTPSKIPTDINTVSRPTTSISAATLASTCPATKSNQKKLSSPFNYQGGKFKLLSQIQPLLAPSKVFVDVFAGGGNVGINTTAPQLIFNDTNHILMGLLGFIREHDPHCLLLLLLQLIAHYQLSDTATYGYDYYGCNSSVGLASYNKEPFLTLRQDFNTKIKQGEVDYLLLYLLIIFSFNNQIRFNRVGEFNLPVGKRDFNAKMQQKFLAFAQRLQQLDVTFLSQDFRQFDLSSLDPDTLLYCDPPYLITTATYNENGKWTDSEEQDLLDWLDQAHALGLKFALSNVLTSNQQQNYLLANWIKERGYHCHYLQKNYTNSNYQRKDKTGSSQEVLVTNY